MDFQTERVPLSHSPLQPLSYGAVGCDASARISDHWHQLQGILGQRMIVSRVEKQLIFDASEYVLTHMPQLIFYPE